MQSEKSTNWVTLKITPTMRRVIRKRAVAAEMGVTEYANLVINRGLGVIDEAAGGALSTSASAIEDAAAQDAAGRLEDIAMELNEVARELRATRSAPQAARGTEPRPPS